MEHINNTSRVIMIFIVLTTMMVGLGCLFLPVETITLWGLDPLNESMKEGAKYFVPDDGLYELAFSAMGIYVLLKNTKAALHTYLTFALTLVILGIGMAALSYFIHQVSVGGWVVIEIAYLIAFLYLKFTN